MAFLLDQKNQAKTLLALVFFIISSIVEISFVASVIPLINLLTGAKSELTGPILNGIFGNTVDKKGLCLFYGLTCSIYISQAFVPKSPSDCYN